MNSLSSRVTDSSSLFLTILPLVACCISKPLLRRSPAKDTSCTMLQARLRMEIGSILLGRRRQLTKCWSISHPVKIHSCIGYSYFSVDGVAERETWEWVRDSFMTWQVVVLKITCTHTALSSKAESLIMQPVQDTVLTQLFFKTKELSLQKCAGHKGKWQGSSEADRSLLKALPDGQG